MHTNSCPPEPEDDNPRTNQPGPDAAPPESDETEVVPSKNVGDTIRASWPFSLDDIRTNIARCSPEGKNALVSAYLWCIDPRHPMHKAEFARNVEYSENLLYQLYTGKYRHPKTGQQYDVPAQLIKNIRAFLAREKQRYTGKTKFVMTPTARRIWTTCDLARESQTPVFIEGVSHIGKSWALEAYATQPEKNHGQTPYVRMKAATGLGGMVKRIAEKLGISPKSNTAKLIDRIKLALTPTTLVILDEVHLLMYTYRKESFFACLEVIREIYDEVGCGMVLCGTKLLLERVKAAEHGEMEQLIRRGVHKLKLPNMPTKDDLKAILTSLKLDFPDPKMKVELQFRGDDGRSATIAESPYAILRQLSRATGLKSITERLRYGCKLADNAKQPLSWRHFVEAHVLIINQCQEIPDWD